MRAIVKTEKKPKATEVMERPIPNVRTNEVLIRVVNVAVCGSDLHLYEFTSGYEKIKTPLIIGHEFSGIIEEKGTGVVGFQIGDRVMGESNRYCSQCINCLKGLTHLCLSSQITGIDVDGAMAEYIAVPAYTLHKLPDHLSFIEGALAQPASVSLNAVFDHCPIEPGESVVVYGPGIQGLIAAQAAKIKGASRVAVVGTDEDMKIRLSKARELGFLALNVGEGVIADQLEASWSTRKVDVVIDASGAVEAVTSGLSLLRRGGHLNLFGIYAKPLKLDLTWMVRAGVTLHTSYTSAWKHYEQSLQLIGSGQLNVKPLISSYAFEDGIQAFEDGLSKAAIKPVLQL